MKKWLTKWFPAVVALAAALPAAARDGACAPLPGLRQPADSVPPAVPQTGEPADSLWAPFDATVIPDDTIDALPAAYRGYLRRMERRRRRWNKLIPNQATLQFAGSIGMLSAGLGWHYGTGDHWETEVLVGFVPRYESETAKATFTAKQRYVPWHLRAGSRWVVEPLTAGVFFNSIFGEDFWANEPSRYPKKYYGFSTKIRAHVFLGQRVKFRIPRARRKYHKSVSLYYELSTCDLYVISALPNKRIKAGDILSLAVGFRFEVF